MIKREKEVINEQVELFEVDLESDIHQLIYEVDVPENFDRAAVFAQAEDGDFSIEVDGVEGSQISEYSKAKLFIGSICTKAKTILIKVSAKGAKNLTLSIATTKRGFKNTINSLPCKVCKAFMKFAVSAVLSHLGVPFLDATKTVDMPAIPIPPESPNEAPVPAKGTVPVLVGEPIQLSEQVKNWFSNIAENSKGSLAEYFNNIDPQILQAIRAIFEVLNWLYEGMDKIYNKTCEYLRCCPTAAQA